MRITIIVFALFVVGCSPKIIPTTRTIIKDSIIYQVKERVVNIAGEKVIVHDTIRCPDNDFPLDFIKDDKVGRVTVRRQLKKGVLTTDCKCDSIVAKVRDSVTKFYKSKETITVLPPKVEYRTYWFDKFCRWFTGIVLVLISGYAFIKFKPSITGTASSIFKKIF